MTPTEDGSVLVFPNTKLNIAPDNGADFNTSSGKYCAEYYGIYSFHLHLYKTGPGNTAECAINKDDGARMETLAHAEVKSGTITGSTSTIVTLEQGDCVYVFDCNGTSLLSDQTSFNGALIDSLE